jgi:hypothetical protein
MKTGTSSALAMLPGAVPEAASVGANGEHDNDRVPRNIVGRWV